MASWAKKIGSLFKKKNPIKLFRRKLKEYLFFKDKRPHFEVNIENIYDKNEFVNRGKNEYFEYGEILNGLFCPLSVLDIGCANGYLLEYFRGKGVNDLLGLEGATSAFDYMPPEVKRIVLRADLSKDLAGLVACPQRKYFLVNCTEVGEHIPCKYEDIFLKNVARFVDRYLVLSWADTWEGWHGFEKQSHVNPRSKRYVINKLSSFNIRFNKTLTKDLIRNLAQRKVYDHWIKRIMVFEKS